MDDELVIPRDEWPSYYRERTNKQLAIEVLHDVTLRPVSEIVSVLRAAGCVVDTASAERDPEKAKRDPGKNEKRRALYDQGLSDAEIAKQLGVARTVICAWRQTNGLPVHGARQRSSNAVQADQARQEMYNAGLIDREIAEKLGVSNASVAAWRKKHGLPPNGKQGGNRMAGQIKVASEDKLPEALREKIKATDAPPPVKSEETDYMTAQALGKALQGMPRGTRVVLQDDTPVTGCYARITFRTNGDQGSAELVLFSE